jgi:predicted ATPase
VPTCEPARVVLAVAHALGIRDAPDGLPLDRLVEALADDPFLLVLDNFGHLLDASPRVGEMLTRSAGRGRHPATALNSPPNPPPSTNTCAATPP